MIEWRYHDCRPSGFEYWDADWGNNYSIAESKIGETRYTVRWYYKGMTDIKEYITASDWDEAKTLAIASVKNYIKQRADYWQALQTNFVSWVNEEKK